MSQVRLSSAQLSNGSVPQHGDFKSTSEWGVYLRDGEFWSLGETNVGNKTEGSFDFLDELFETSAEPCSTQLEDGFLFPPSFAPGVSPRSGQTLGWAGEFGWQDSSTWSLDGPLSAPRIPKTSNPITDFPAYLSPASSFSGASRPGTPHPKACGPEPWNPLVTPSPPQTSDFPVGLQSAGALYAPFFPVTPQRPAKPQHIAQPRYPMTCFPSPYTAAGPSSVVLRKRKAEDSTSPIYDKRQKVDNFGSIPAIGPSRPLGKTSSTAMTRVIPWNPPSPSSHHGKSRTGIPSVKASTPRPRRELDPQVAGTVEERTCAVCNIVLSKKGYLPRHMTTHNIPCPDCGELQLNARKMRAHRPRCFVTLAKPLHS